MPDNNKKGIDLFKIVKDIENRGNIKDATGISDNMRRESNIYFQDELHEYDFLNQGSFTQTSLGLDDDEFEKRMDKGISLSPYFTKNEMTKIKADSQSVLEQTGNALMRIGLGEMFYGVIGGIFNIADGLVNSITGSYTYQDLIAKFFNEQKERIDKKYEIYRKNPDDPFNIGDFGWWADNAVSIATSLSLMLPAAGWAKGVSILGKIPMIGKVGKAATKGIAKGYVKTIGNKAASSANKISRLRSMEGQINKADRALRNFLGYTGTAALSRAGENQIEANSVYNIVKEDALENIQGMIEADKANGTNEFKKFLENNPELDGLSVEEIANEIANNAADKTFYGDWAMLLSDIIQFRAVGGLASNAMKRISTPRQRISAENIKRTLGGAKPEELIKNNFWNRRKESFKHVFKHPTSILTNLQLSEAIEEMWQGAYTEKGFEVAQRYFDPTITPRSFNSYIRDLEIWEQGFWGALGGIAFGAGAKQVNNLKDYIHEVKNKKKMSAEDFEMWKKSRDNVRQLDSDKIISDVNKLVDSIKSIEDGNNPYKFQTNDVTGETKLDANGKPIMEELTEEEKDELIDRVINEFVDNRVMSSIDNGTYYLIKDILESKQLDKYLHDKGVRTTTSEKFITDNIIDRIDYVGGLYQHYLDEVEYNNTENNNPFVTRLTASQLTREKMNIDTTQTKLDNVRKVINITKTKEANAANVESNDIQTVIDNYHNDILINNIARHIIKLDERISKLDELVKDKKISKEAAILYKQDYEKEKTNLQNIIEDNTLKTKLDELVKNTADINLLKTVNIATDKTDSISLSEELKDLIKTEANLQITLAQLNSSFNANSEGFKSRYNEIAQAHDTFVKNKIQDYFNTLANYINKAKDKDAAYNQLIEYNKNDPNSPITDKKVREALEVIRYGYINQTGDLGTNSTNYINNKMQFEKLLKDVTDKSKTNEAILNKGKQSKDSAITPIPDTTIGITGSNPTPTPTPQPSLTQEEQNKIKRKQEISDRINKITEEIDKLNKEKDKLEDESYSIGDEIMHTESSIDETNNKLKEKSKDKITLDKDELYNNISRYVIDKIAFDRIINIVEDTIYHISHNVQTDSEIKYVASLIKAASIYFDFIDIINDRIKDENLELYSTEFIEFGYKELRFWRGVIDRNISEIPEELKYISDIIEEADNYTKELNDFTFNFYTNFINRFLKKYDYDITIASKDKTNEQIRNEINEFKKKSTEDSTYEQFLKQLLFRETFKEYVNKQKTIDAEIDKLEKEKTDKEKELNTLNEKNKENKDKIEENNKKINDLNNEYTKLSEELKELDKASDEPTDSSTGEGELTPPVEFKDPSKDTLPPEKLSTDDDEVNNDLGSDPTANYEEPQAEPIDTSTIQELVAIAIHTEIATLFATSTDEYTDKLIEGNKEFDKLINTLKDKVKKVYEENNVDIPTDNLIEEETINNYLLTISKFSKTNKRYLRYKNLLLGANLKSLIKTLSDKDREDIFTILNKFLVEYAESKNLIKHDEKYIIRLDELFRDIVKDSIGKKTITTDELINLYNSISLAVHEVSIRNKFLKDIKFTGLNKFNKLSSAQYIRLISQSRELAQKQMADQLHIDLTDIYGIQDPDVRNAVASALVNGNQIIAEINYLDDGITANTVSFYVYYNDKNGNTTRSKIGALRCVSKNSTNDKITTNNHKTGFSYNIDILPNNSFRLDTDEFFNSLFNGQQNELLKKLVDYQLSRAKVFADVYSASYQNYDERTRDLYNKLDAILTAEDISFILNNNAIKKLLDNKIFKFTNNESQSLSDKEKCEQLLNAINIILFYSKDSLTRKTLEEEIDLADNITTNIDTIKASYNEWKDKIFDNYNKTYEIQKAIEESPDRQVKLTISVDINELPNIVGKEEYQNIGDGGLSLNTEDNPIVGVSSDNITLIDENNSHFGYVSGNIPTKVGKNQIGFFIGSSDFKETNIDPAIAYLLVPNNLFEIQSKDDISKRLANSFKIELTNTINSFLQEDNGISYDELVARLKSLIHYTDGIFSSRNLRLITPKNANYVTLLIGNDVSDRNNAKENNIAITFHRLDSIGEFSSKTISISPLHYDENNTITASLKTISSKNPQIYPDELKDSNTGLVNPKLLPNYIANIIASNVNNLIINNSIEVLRKDSVGSNYLVHKLSGQTKVIEMNLGNSTFTFNGGIGALLIDTNSYKTNVKRINGQNSPMIFTQIKLENGASVGNIYRETGEEKQSIDKSNIVKNLTDDVRNTGTKVTRNKLTYFVKEIDTIELLTLFNTDPIIIDILTKQQELGILSPKTTVEVRGKTAKNLQSETARYEINENKIVITQTGLNDIVNDRTDTALVRNLLHENIHRKLNELKKIQIGKLSRHEIIISELEDIYESFREFVSKDNSDLGRTIQKEIIDVLETNYSNNKTVKLEEFLTESLTQKTLTKYINNITYNRKDNTFKYETEKKSIFQKIIDIILKIFGIDKVNANTILAEEYKILGDILEQQNTTSTNSDVIADTDSSTSPVGKGKELDAPADGKKRKGFSRKFDNVETTDNPSFKPSLTTTLQDNPTEIKIEYSENNRLDNPYGITFVDRMNTMANKFDKEYREGINSAIENNDFNYTCK